MRRLWRRRAAGDRSAAGPEGSLFERARAGGVPLEIIDCCGGRSIPGAIWSAIGRSKRRFAASGRRWCIRTAARAACWAGRPPGRWACRRLSTPSTAHRSTRGRAGGRGGFSGLRTLGRPALPRPGQRGRRHDRSDGRRGRRPAGKVHHGLQRHGGRAVLAIGRASRARPAGVGLRARTRRDRQDRPAVQAQGPRRRDPGGPQWSMRPPSPNYGFSSSATACFAAALERQIAAAGLTGLLSVHRPGAARADSGADRGDGRGGPREPARRACPRVAAGVDAGQAGGKLRRGRRAEVVITGETGFLVPPRDVEQLAARLSLLGPIPPFATGWPRKAAGGSPTSFATNR